MHPFEAPLRAGLTALQLALSNQQIAQLLAYQDLIQKWTKVYNLTAVRDPAEMLTHHLLDSLAAAAPLVRELAALGRAGGVAPARRLLDVGSGAGLPGVVFAICVPDLEVHCVDAVAKKAAFIQQVAASLNLGTLKGLHARVESLTAPYGIVSSRAFASLPDFVRWSSSALTEGGVWMALKGKYPMSEVAALPEGVAMFHVEPLQVPGLEADRCIVWMRRTPA
jgi:16S rRNA (guanine527-N7)-methyltransferase